jgi:hypothetical protein
MIKKEEKIDSKFEELNLFLKKLFISNEVIQKFILNEVDFNILQTLSYEDLKNE